MSISTPSFFRKKGSHNSQNLSPIEKEYHHILSFFKYLVTISIFAITLITSFGLYWLGKDREALMESHKSSILSLTNEFKEVKDKAQLTIEETKDEVHKYTLSSEEEIQKIKVQAKEMAISQAKETISNTLAEPSLNELIRTEASQYVQDTIGKLTQNETKARLDETIVVNRWALSFINGGDLAWQEYNHRINGLNPEMQRLMKGYYEQIRMDYESNASSAARLIDNNNVNSYLPEIPNGLPNSELIKRLKSRNYSDSSLRTTCLRIKLLGKLENKTYRCFEDANRVGVDTY